MVREVPCDNNKTNCDEKTNLVWFPPEVCEWVGGCMSVWMCAGVFTSVSVGGSVCLFSVGRSVSVCQLVPSLFLAADVACRRQVASGCRFSILVVGNW